jgi:putative SOS response-associated peptidase YedK
MCGRFILTSPGTDIARAFGLGEAPAVEPRYNIAPTQPALVVRETEAGDREGAALRWGLVPFWADDESLGQRMINARSETAPKKPAFRAAFRRRRCLVPCDGFYEWAPGKPRKRPHLIRIGEAGGPFALAGLWERWEPNGREPLESFTILTTEANDAVRPLHDRMPVVLAPDDYPPWLAPGPLAADLAERWNAPWPAAETHASEVGLAVNDPRHDGPDCIEQPDAPLLPT